MGATSLGGPVPVVVPTPAVVSAVTNAPTNVTNVLSNGSITSAASWTNIGAQLTITAGATGVVVLTFTANLADSSSFVSHQAIAAQSAADAASMAAATLTGLAQVSTSSSGATTFSISGVRVVTGLTPGTAYTFAVYGHSSTTAAAYSVNGGTTPGLGATLVAQTY